MTCMLSSTNKNEKRTELSINKKGYLLGEVAGCEEYPIIFRL